MKIPEAVKEAWGRKEGAVILETRRNIKAGSKGAALFMTSDKKPYQLKGTMEYHESGPLFDDMKKWNPPKHPGHAAAALVVEEVYSGAQRVTA